MLTIIQNKKIVEKNNSSDSDSDTKKRKIDSKEEISKKKVKGEIQPEIKNDRRPKFCFICHFSFAKSSEKVISF